MVKFDKGFALLPFPYSCCGLFTVQKPHWRSSKGSFGKLSSWLWFFVESHFPFRLGLPSLILVSQLLRVAFANHWVVRFFFLPTKLVSICLQLEAFVQSMQRHEPITLNKNTSNTFPWRIHVIMVYDLHLRRKINHSCRNKPGFNNQSAGFNNQTWIHVGKYRGSSHACVLGLTPTKLTPKAQVWSKLLPVQCRQFFGLLVEKIVAVHLPLWWIFANGIG